MKSLSKTTSRLHPPGLAQRWNFRMVAMAIFMVICVFRGKIFAQSDDNWVVPMRVQIDSVDFNLSFGVDPNATDGYDSGIDSLAPPPGFSPHVIFAIPVIPNLLWRDIRPPNNTISWTLRTFNAFGKTISISWDTSQFPINSTLTMSDTLDMLGIDSTGLAGDVALQIKFIQTPVSVSEDVPDELPKTIHIQAYPNPFRINMIFRINHTVASPIEFRLFNMLGQEIRSYRFFNSVQGALFVSWDGMDAQGRPVPAGIYFYEARANRSLVKGKILRMR